MHMYAITMQFQQLRKLLHQEENFLKVSQKKKTLHSCPVTNNTIALPSHLGLATIGPGHPIHLNNAEVYQHTEGLIDFETNSLLLEKKFDASFFQARHLIYKKVSKSHE